MIVITVFILTPDVTPNTRKSRILKFTCVAMILSVSGNISAILSVVLNAITKYVRTSANTHVCCAMVNWSYVKAEARRNAAHSLEFKSSHLSRML